MTLSSIIGRGFPWGRHLVAEVIAFLVGDTCSGIDDLGLQESRSRDNMPRVIHDSPPHLLGRIKQGGLRKSGFPFSSESKRNLSPSSNTPRQTIMKIRFSKLVQPGAVRRLSFWQEMKNLYENDDRKGKKKYLTLKWLVIKRHDCRGSFLHHGTLKHFTFNREARINVYLDRR